MGRTTTGSGNGQLREQVRLPPGRADHRLVVATTRCERAGLRLTPLRRDVLALLLANPRAVGAYELLDAMRVMHPGAQPPTVYRALEFLREAGLAHRIDALNAFVACTLAEHDHSLLLVCPACGKVSEVNDPEVFHLLAKHAAQAGFHLPNACLEVKASCARCAPAADTCCAAHAG
ncbi:MAG: Fur family transcriptional regulator [Gammaproteobacteria bacterium]